KTSSTLVSSGHSCRAAPERATLLCVLVTPTSTTRVWNAGAIIRGSGAAGAAFGFVRLVVAPETALAPALWEGLGGGVATRLLEISSSSSVMSSGMRLI